MACLASVMKVEAKLGITSLRDWYNVTYRDVIQAGGHRFIRSGGGSVSLALTNAYPDVQWKQTKFRCVSERFWDNHSNVIDVVRDIEEQLDIKKIDDWYQVSGDDIVNAGGKKILAKYKGSLVAMIRAVYSDTSWQSWKFTNVSPHHGWHIYANRLAWLIDYEKKQEINKIEDWYTVTTRQIKQVPGSDMIYMYYGGSLHRCLHDMYPDYRWESWRFASVPMNYWSKSHNRLNVVRSLEKSLGIFSIDEWHSIKHSKIKSIASGIIGYYGDLKNLVQDMYPDHPWRLDAFRTRTKHILSTQTWDKSREYDFIQQVKKTYNLTSKNDWFRISLSQLVHNYGTCILPILSKYRKPIPKGLSKVRRGTQRVLFVKANDLFTL